MPLSENDQRPETNGALPVSTRLAPGDASRAAARNAPLRRPGARAANASSAQIGRDRAVPLGRRRGRVVVPGDAPAVGVGVARDLAARAVGLTSERVGRVEQQAPTARRWAEVRQVAAHQRLTRRARSGSRRRSGGGWGSPSCGTSCAPRSDGSPTIRRAAPCTRSRRTPRSTRGTGTRGTRGTARKSDAVHSQTSPSMPCDTSGADVVGP